MRQGINLEAVFLTAFYISLGEYAKGNGREFPDAETHEFFSKYCNDFEKYTIIDYVKETRAILDLPLEASEALIRTAEEIDADTGLRAFFTNCCGILFSNCKKSENVILGGELLEKLGEKASLFPVLVLIAGIERLQAYYSFKGINKEVLADTLSDIRVWMLSSQSRYGLWGITAFPWLLAHLSGRIYKLGRLQFGPSAFTGGLYAYRNKKTGEVIALSVSGIEYRKDGLINGTNDFYEECYFKSEYMMEGSLVRGNPVLPSGTVQKEMVQLSLDNWELVLEKGDILLAVHIPEGGRMDFDQCGCSFSNAVGFFRQYFPKVPFKGFSCGSWLLDPQLRQLLPEKSNIVRFQKEFYLYPIKCGDEAILDRVFSCTREDFGKVEPVTALQRSIKDYMQKGGRLHSAGMFLLTEDLAWGSRIYQRS